MPTRWRYTTLLLLLATVVQGQLARHYTFTHYGSTTGIASNEVFCVTQDDDGFLWIGTTNGLQRFDGMRFRTFRCKKNNPETLPGNVIQQLMVDRKKNLWVMAGEKVGIFDTRLFKFRDVPIHASDPLWAKNSKILTRDEYGNIFLIIANLELLTYNAEKNEFSPVHNFIQFPREWGIISLFQEAGTKKYWIGSQHGMALYNAGTKQLNYAGHNPEKEDLINRMAAVKATAGLVIDKKERLWYYTWKDGAPVIYAYDLKKRQFLLHEYSLLPLVKKYHEVSDVMVQNDGTVWIKGLGVFARFIEKEKRFELVHNGYENEQSIAYGRVTDLYEDRDQNIWVGTSDNALYRFTPADQFFNNIRHIHRVSGKPGDGSMMSFIRMRDGTILAGAWGDGLYHFDSTFNAIPLNIRGLSEKGTASMWGMCLSSDNNTIWAGSQPGIFRIDQNKRTATFYNPPQLKERTVRQVAEDKFGNLWIGTQSIGLFKWTKEKGSRKFDDGISFFDNIPPCQVLKIYIDKKGLVWVCTSNVGLYVIDPATSEVVMHFSANEAPAHKLLWDGVASVITYDDSTMIIAANGLHLYNTRQQRIIKTIPIPESIPGVITAMEKDKFGYLWVSMSSGLLRVNPRNEIFIHFDRVDGIANDHFIVAASYRLPDGKIIFGADNQLVYFDPLKVHINDPAPDVSVTGFRLMNKPLLVDSLLKKQVIELKPEDNSIAIEFSALSYNSTYIIRYMLEGLEKEWQHADNTGQAVYSYLPAGTYTFLLKSEDAEGNSSKNITRLVIRVNPPFWKTWWFFCLLLLLVAAIIFWFDRQRIKRLVVLQRVRTEIAGNLHEEVNTTLNNINLLSEMARIKADRDIDRSKEYIDQISVKSHNMITAMDDILWSIDPQNDTMEKSLLRMMEFADFLKTKYGASVEIALDKRVRSLKLDMKTRHEVFLIFKEALKMIVELSGGKGTLIHIDLFKSKLSVKMHDASASLDKNTSEIDESIREMNTRAQFIGADIDVQYEKTGVVVLLLVPVI